MKATYKPKSGERFWHIEYNEWCYFERLMPDGNYLCCLKPRRLDNDDYYSYHPSVLQKNAPDWY